MLTGTAGLSAIIPPAVQRAMAIEAAPGTTFYDAEHVVFLMQENRSFDHLFGKLKGVRGFNDPRTHLQPNGNKVWLQQDKEGHTYPPFHVDIHKTKITWQGGLPHSWNDQVAARNEGKYDQWIPVKSVMSMAHYERQDVPFYYALADAFTICDHSFCSLQTGTTPNRLFFWSGTIRPEQNGQSTAIVENEQAESHTNTFVDWDTFPELLEDHDVSWKVYQHELWTSKLRDKRIGDWVDNYGDNALEYVERYNVRLSEYFRKHGDHSDKERILSPREVTEKYNALSQREKNLINKAFATNISIKGDHLELEPFHFVNDQGKKESLNLPKHDIFHQFRSDVENGTLPTVSWLVAPQRFSDHTSTPLYGTWYVSEALDILTKNPEIWKKTIFVLTYDENDGYFDHIPPFVPPNPGDPDSGKVSPEMNTATEWESRKGCPIGLGYRVPMIIASPWSKGGLVNSQIFDHSSSLMFLENFLSKKTGKEIRSKQIGDWRRAVCGDLTSVFRAAGSEPTPAPASLKRDKVVAGIQNAKNKPAQAAPAPLTKQEISAINAHHPFAAASSGAMPMQEPGVRNACALPYQLFAEAEVSKAAQVLELRFESEKNDDNIQAGAPFALSSKLPYHQENGKTWDYAVVAGGQLQDNLNLNAFPSGRYDLVLRSANGFYRNFKGSLNDPDIKVACLYEKKGLFKPQPSGHIQLTFENSGSQVLELAVDAGIYEPKISRKVMLQPQGRTTLKFDLSKSDGWYDVQVSMNGGSYLRHYAGHAENGEVSISDPYMGGMLT
jgi:phospholipase C